MSEPGALPQRGLRRASFDRVARTYASARLGYPPSVYDAIAARVPPPARVLEIGPGPGLATLPMAERGYRILAIELGEAMAELARERLAGHPLAAVVAADFDAWQPPADGAYDLVLAASSWHWLDPASRDRRVHDLLRPGGWLALVANHPRPGRIGSRVRAFWDATDAIYRREAPELVAERHWDPRRQPYTAAHLRRSGCFDHVERLTWGWRHDFEADAYLALLDTYSDHRALPATRFRALKRAIRSLIRDRFGGVAPRLYLTHLHLAQRP